MPVRQPGNLEPGLEGVQEEVTASVTISDSASGGTVTLNLSGDYDSPPEVAGLSASRENSSMGSEASSYVAGHDVDGEGATVDAIDVDVYLDAAPGSGESVDVVVSAWVSGDAAK